MQSKKGIVALTIPFFVVYLRNKISINCLVVLLTCYLVVLLFCCFVVLLIANTKQLNNDTTKPQSNIDVLRFPTTVGTEGAFEGLRKLSNGTLFCTAPYRVSMMSSIALRFFSVRGQSSAICPKGMITTASKPSQGNCSRTTAVS